MERRGENRKRHREKDCSVKERKENQAMNWKIETGRRRGES